uniref:Uncharacterized protein n=1 Tax=Aegilops tauschii subsp. strangulata TaxID=200361 RepID=A0A452YLQ7_AEGTS
MKPASHSNKNYYNHTNRASCNITENHSSMSCVFR